MNRFTKLLQSKHSNCIRYLGYVERKTDVADDVTSTAWEDVKDMQKTFVVPDNGKVVVRLSGTSVLDPAVSGHGWAVREGELVHASAHVGGNTTNAEDNYVSIPFLITGLKPGNKITLKWSHSRSGNGNARIMSASRFGGFGGPVVMEITTVI